MVCLFSVRMGRGPCVDGLGGSQVESVRIDKKGAKVDEWGLGGRPWYFSRRMGFFWGGGI